ncbi:hypothetical protein OG285_16110 [Streptomyces sp. NBC_01471]|uniref:hypothetical protein n=1 Tax=Streptomyces sp. NBC_01471 TaxID=2903879 RepID=UPI0032503D60
MNPFLMSLFLSGPMPKNAHMAEGEQFREGLVASIAHFDRERAQQAADLAEQERQQVLALFPLESWGGLELQQYALGPEGRRSGLSFCRLMEYGTDNFGSIRGGSAAKHIVYQHRSGQWRVVPSALRGLEVEAAWAQVRSEFVTAFDVAQKGAYKPLDDLESLSYGQALTTKALAASPASSCPSSRRRTSATSPGCWAVGPAGTPPVCARGGPTVICSNSCVRSRSSKGGVRMN